MKRFVIAGWAMAVALAVASPVQNPVDAGAADVTNTVAPAFAIDVRNGDQQGKLMLKDSELAFESLTDARHSRNWKYADLREISKKRKELSVKPFKGSKYSFQFRDNGTRDRIYQMIADRILTARQGN